MDYSKLGQAAVAAEDLTVEQKTTRELPVEGKGLIRLRDYIETGRHEAKNPQHKASLKVLLTFELSHPKHCIEIDGVKVPQQITVRVNKTYSDKGKYMPLFKAMNRALDNKYNHFVEMIDKPMMCEIYHNEYEGKKYANLDIDGAWSFAKPVVENIETGEVKNIRVAELDGKPKVFLWEMDGISDEDILEMWDSIYIEGTRQNDKGADVSKNWIQEAIMENVEWEGSTTQALTQKHVELDDLGAAASGGPEIDFDDDIPF